MRTSRKTTIIVLAALAAVTVAANGAMAGSDAVVTAPAIGTSADLLAAPTDWRPRCHAIRDGWVSRMSCPGGRDSVVGWRAD